MSSLDLGPKGRTIGGWEGMMDRRRRPLSLASEAALMAVPHQQWLVLSYRWGPLDPRPTITVQRRSVETGDLLAQETYLADSEMHLWEQGLTALNDVLDRQQALW